MDELPTIQDRGFVNTVIHSLTGAQILFHLLHVWRDEPTRSVILWCRKGEALAKMSAIRVALSKERGVRGTPRTFELRFSEQWPYTHEGIKGEAIKVERVAGTIMTRMQAAMMSIQTKKE